MFKTHKEFTYPEYGVVLLEVDEKFTFTLKLDSDPRKEIKTLLTFEFEEIEQSAIIFSKAVTLLTKTDRLEIFMLSVVEEGLHRREDKTK